MKPPRLKKLLLWLVMLSIGASLSFSTRPVHAEEDVVGDVYFFDDAVEVYAMSRGSYTWRAAGREAITWGVCGAVGAGAFAAVFGTPACLPAAAVGGAAGLVGGFLTYSAGWAYDRLFGRYSAYDVAPDWGVMPDYFLDQPYQEDYYQQRTMEQQSTY
jgi:hypothetical protein